MTAPAAAAAAGRFSAHVVVIGVDPDTLALNGTEDTARVTRSFGAAEDRDAWVLELDDRSVLALVIAYVNA